MTRENENGQEKKENTKRNTRKTNAEIRNYTNKKGEKIRKKGNRK